MNEATCRFCGIDYSEPIAEALCHNRLGDGPHEWVNVAGDLIEELASEVAASIAAEVDEYLADVHNFLSEDEIEENFDLD